MLPSKKSPINASDRFGFTIFLALCIHLIIVLGIGFVARDKTSSNHKSLNVVLARHASEEAPEEADFIGQENQLSGGEGDKVTPPSTPIKAPFPDQLMNESAAMEQQQKQQLEKKNRLNSFDSKQKVKLSEAAPNKVENKVNAMGSNQSLRAQAIASLQAELDVHRVAEAKRSRRRVVSAAVHKSSDALYLDAWQRKVEKVGNLNYPSRAKKLNLSGSLRMKVAVRHDGSIEEVSIIESSGNKVLDDAALRIVRLAAPYSPLSAEIRKTTDVLEIIRTWQFLPGNRISTH